MSLLILLEFINFVDNLVEIWRLVDGQVQPYFLIDFFFQKSKRYFRFANHLSLCLIIEFTYYFDFNNIDFLIFLRIQDIDLNKYK